MDDLRRGSSNRALAAFIEISARMVSSLDLDETLEAITRSATTLLNADVSAIFLTAPDQGGLVLRGVHGNRSPLWSGLQLDPEHGLNSQARRTRAVALVDDYLGDAGRTLPLPARRVVRQEPIRSAMAMPIQRRRVVIGTIGVYRRVVRPFGPEDEHLLRLLSQQAGIALDNAFTYAELEATGNRLQAFLNTTDAIWRVTSFDEVAQLVVDEASRLLPRVACLIGVVPPDRPHALVFTAGTPGWAADLIGTVHPLAETKIASRVIAAGEVIESDSFSSVSRIARSMTGASRIETARLIPLGEPLPDGRTRLGILGFYRGGRGSFSAEERQVMDEFGKRVSIALHRAELLRLADSARVRLETAIEVAADLSGSLDPSEVIRRVLIRAVAAGQADRGVLLRIDGAETVVEDFHDLSGGEDLIGYRHPISRQPLMRRAVSSRTPVLGAGYDVSHFEPPLDRSLADVRHTATIPLILDGVVTAAMVLSRRTDLPFLSGDLAMFQLIGNQAVLALRNARLFSQAQAITRMQSDFLNMAAHELRTPLSVIAGYVSMLEDGTLGQPPRHWRGPLSTLRNKSAELETLISELLIASRLESDSIPFGGGEIDLREAAFAALDRLEPRASLLEASVTHRFPVEPVRVKGDGEHIARILDNLLNNALSYSPVPPRVAVLVRDGDDPRVEVKDRGRGIPAAERDRVFERFYRIDDGAARHIAGTGLGLYISRQLAVRMGGSVVLERSSVGKGSTFTLRLPSAQ